MKVIPIAFDSLGVRSMATFVETADTTVFIDPSAALCPRRYGLPPHQIEIEELENALNRIASVAENAEIIVITHYHYDHHNPNFPELVNGKIVFLKHPRDHINVSQRIRAARFLKLIESKAKPKGIEYADDRSIKIGDTIIRFSTPVPHGINDRLGYVIMVSIKYENETFLFTSDVEGPSLDEQTRIILRENPSLILLDGPMTYMLGYRYPMSALQNTLNNLKEIVSKTQVETIIIDHHFMRDLEYKKYVKEMQSIMPRKISIISAAEFLGKEPLLLEARRKELYSIN
ncbi:MAG: hypothetical protein DRJ66_01565 [Thermoprotei archaeon]|nr:MAG: hypothetical protein DRJ66_01565 [Thermoprotei archaeon]RLF20857.1 MAG: hypothetical protein DRZ82_01025 [Thermoprotei archaeon]